MNGDRLTSEDNEAWGRYLRHVRPLPGRMQPAAVPSPEPVAPATPPPASPARRPNSPGSRRQAVSVGDQPPGLDRASWKRLEGGRTPVARQLDLHGYTVDGAFGAVERFLHTASQNHLRCVEIVTGRGRGGGGVIGRELPLWLNLPQLRPLVLAVAYAGRHNTGAVRILLRRRRNG